MDAAGDRRGFDVQLSRASPSTPSSRGKPSRARCSDQSSAEPRGSASMTTTRLPRVAQVPATWSDKVVLPTPPF